MQVLLNKCLEDLLDPAEFSSEPAKSAHLLKAVEVLVEPVLLHYSPVPSEPGGRALYNEVALDKPEEIKSIALAARQQTISLKWEIKSWKKTVVLPKCHMGARFPSTPVCMGSRVTACSD